MIIQCEGCASKYFLPESKVPPSPTRVRCPQCRAVFTLAPVENLIAGAAERVVSSLPQSSAKPVAEAPSPTATETPVEQAAPKKKKKAASGDVGKNARAKRLARVLVSDIVAYNQEKRDQALVDGNLMAVLGDEIKKSWELYKEKVGADVANSTNYFKEALNEILANGQKVF